MNKREKKSNIKKMLQVYFIAGTQDCLHLGNNPQENLLFILEEALKNGITCFQFREKGKNSLQDKKEIFNLIKKATGIHIGKEDKKVKCETTSKSDTKQSNGLDLFESTRSKNIAKPLCY